MSCASPRKAASNIHFETHSRVARSQIETTGKSIAVAGAGRAVGGQRAAGRREVRPSRLVAGTKEPATILRQ
jgi:hypothetical protein